GRALNPHEIEAIYNSDLNRGQAIASAASELSAVSLASILATSVPSSGSRVVMSSSTVRPGPATSSVGITPATVPAVTAPASGVPVALAGGGGPVDAVLGNLNSLVVNEPFVALGPGLR